VLQSVIENMAPVLTWIFTPLFTALLLYAISARDSQAPPGRFDVLQLLLVACALIVDALALWARAALGLNLLLLVNLAWSAVLYVRFIGRRLPFTRLERWQTVYMPAFAVWAWFVTALFPVIFGQLPSGSCGGYVSLPVPHLQHPDLNPDGRCVASEADEL
jgi:hypothetical protein